MAEARSKRPNQPSARQLHEARIEEVRRSYDEIEAIMADPDVAIELLEQAGFTVIRPDEPAVPESMEPAAVVPPTRRQLMMLASDMGMASIDEAVMKFALAALARWGIRQGILDSSGGAPPPELVEKWIAQVWHEGTPVQVAASDLHIATQAARWGAAHALPPQGGEVEG